MKLSELLEDGVVCFLNSNRRDESLRTLVEALASSGKIPDAQLFFDAVLKREKIVTTSIGMGVAVPHARLEGLSHFFLAVGVQKSKEGIEDWKVIDRSFVKLIFMIGGPKDQQTEYLSILSRLTEAVKNEERLRSLLKAKNSEEIVDLFSEC